MPRGYTLLELLFALALIVTLAGITVGIGRTVTAVVPGDSFDSSDPIQIGQSTLMSFAANGSSTAGSVYIRGTKLNQFAVRVLGVTARSRIFVFDFGAGKWNTR